MRARVIGLGSPFGDDAVGLHVAQRLAQATLPRGVEVIARDRPGIALLEGLEDVDVVVLIDAVRSGAAPGTLHELHETRLARSHGTSSHGIGVAEALALARALGRCVPRLHLIGIAIAPQTAEHAADATLSPAVAAAIGPACDAALRALSARTRGTAGPPAGTAAAPCG